MRYIILAAFFGLGLAGCTPYDQTAVPGAAAGLDQALERCASNVQANDPRRYSDFTACQLAAERSFAVAIQLQKMDVFDVYARQMQQVAAERDANTLSSEQATVRVISIQQEYTSHCDCMPRPVSDRRWAPVSDGSMTPFYNGNGAPSTLAPSMGMH